METTIGGKDNRLEWVIYYFVNDCAECLRID
jgi:hypothetical protein